MRLPVPFQPVLIRYTFAPDFSTLSASIWAYTEGSRGRKGSPKQVEKVGTGSLMPISVPATLEVKPDTK